MDFSGATFSGGEVDFIDTEFSGANLNFNRAVFSGAQVRFVGASFSGGTAAFSDTRFTSGEVHFTGAAFTGGNVSFANAEFAAIVNFRDPHDWSVPPQFSHHSAIVPRGLLLPAPSTD